MDPETGLTEIGGLEDIGSSEEILYRKWKVLQQDEQILNYVHKKFRKIVIPEDTKEPNLNIMEIDEEKSDIPSN